MSRKSRCRHATRLSHVADSAILSTFFADLANRRCERCDCATTRYAVTGYGCSLRSGLTGHSLRYRKHRCCRDRKFNRYLSKKRCDSYLQAGRGQASGLADTPPPYQPLFANLSNCVQSGTRWKVILRLAGCAHRGQVSSWQSRHNFGYKLAAKSVLRDSHDSWSIDVARAPDSCMVGSMLRSLLRSAVRRDRRMRTVRDVGTRVAVTSHQEEFGDIDRPPENDRKGSRSSQQIGSHVLHDDRCTDSAAARECDTRSRIRRDRSRSQER